MYLRVLQKAAPKPASKSDRFCVPTYSSQADGKKSFQELGLDKTKGLQEKKQAMQKQKLITRESYKENLEALETKRVKQVNNKKY